MENKYKTSWNLANRQNIDKSFFEMIQDGMQNTPLFRNKQLFFQYVILLYAAGRRRIEPFLMPVTITKNEDDKMKYYEVKSALAKHFDGKAVKCIDCGEVFKNIKEWQTHAEKEGHKHKPKEEKRRSYSHYSEREYTETYVITENVHEHALMQYLMQGRQRVTIDFTPLLPPRFRSLDPAELMSREYQSSMFSGITKKFRMFKLSITDGKRIVENTSIVPHMLRHMRVYDLKVTHKYSNAFIQKAFGWNREMMVEYYADVRHMLGKEAMLEEMKQHRAMLPFINVDVKTHSSEAIK
jgi:uncharacterized C2H2 Zn-finger protein